MRDDKEGAVILRSIFRTFVCSFLQRSDRLAYGNVQRSGMDFALLTFRQTWERVSHASGKSHGDGVVSLRFIPSAPLLFPTTPRSGLVAGVVWFLSLFERTNLGAKTLLKRRNDDYDFLVSSKAAVAEVGGHGGIPPFGAGVPLKSGLGKRGDGRHD
jgi:hypothetical protein